MPYLYSMRLSVRNLFFFWYMIPNEDIIDFFIVINLLCSKIHGCVSGTCMHTTIHLLLCTIINYACNSKQLQVCVNHCTDRKSLVQISLVAGLLFLFFLFHLMALYSLLSSTPDNEEVFQCILRFRRECKAIGPSIDLAQLAQPGSY